MICFCYNFSDTSKKTNVYKIKSRTRRSQILTCVTILVLVSKKLLLHWKNQPFRKNVIVEKVLDCIDIDDSGYLENSPRLVFIDEECGKLIVVNDSAELTRNINQPKEEVRCFTVTYRCLLRGKCCRPEYLFSNYV